MTPGPETRAPVGPDGERIYRLVELARARAPAGPDSERICRLVALARALDAHCQDDEGRCACIEALGADSRHFQTLLDLGTLLTESRHRRPAKTALLHALRARPDSPDAHASLATLLVALSETSLAREHFETAIRLNPGHRSAHEGLAVLLLRLGETEAGQRHARLGFHGRAIEWRYRGEGRPLSLLLMLSARDGNVPLNDLVSDRTVRKWTPLISEFCDPDAELPPHDIVLNAIGDSDCCRVALDRALRVLSRTSAPVLNPPSRVLETGRAANAARLGRLPGVVTARTEEVPREILAGPTAARVLAAKGFGWPLLIRSPGFHTGEHFAKVDGPGQLGPAVKGLPGSRLLVIQFIDTAGPDGKYRKYRVMMIDGKRYPLHLAVSTSWKVHFFSAAMNEPLHQAEDKAFLDDMPSVLGPRAMEALRRIQQILGLDYGGCDFALDRSGNLVVFEANATMVIVPPGEGPFAYRAAAVDRVRKAVTRMLPERAGRLARSPARTSPRIVSERG